MTDHVDQLYSRASGPPRRFQFDARVARVFQDMISRSVPGYQQILEMLPTLTRRFTFTNHRYYDLGCSLGAGMLAMAQGLDQTPHQLIGIDSSAAMLKRAKDNLAGFDCQLIEQNIEDSQLDKAGMVLMNFTLQFIPLGERAELIEKIHRGLCPGGALVLSEKIKCEDTETEKALIDIHHQYKSDQGYSDLEISQKRDAIIDVLIPETLDTHISRLKKAGFSIVTPWVQNLQFLSILAIK